MTNVFFRRYLVQNKDTMTLQVQKRLLTVEEYHQMSEVGILTEEDRVELINGEIIKMSPIKSKHAGHVNRIDTFLKRLIGDKAIIAVQNPVRLNNISEPEPDIAILKFQNDFYTLQHPQPKDVYILIEVSLSTEKIDQEIKLPLYANAGIEEYWIVNLNKEQIEIYRSPKKDTYKYREIVFKGDTITLKQFSLSIDVKHLIP